MVNLLFCDDDALLRKRASSRHCSTLPAARAACCGCRGRLRDLNPAATLQVHGQELNARTYAICRSDMMTKGQDAENIAYGNSFTSDEIDGEKFDYRVRLTGAGASNVHHAANNVVTR